MLPAVLHERLDSLIDDLIMNGGIEAASLASILVAAKDSVVRDYHGSLSRRVWAAVSELELVKARVEEVIEPEWPTAASELSNSLAIRTSLRRSEILPFSSEGTGL